LEEVLPGSRSVMFTTKMRTDCQAASTRVLSPDAAEGYEDAAKPLSAGEWTSFFLFRPSAYAEGRVMDAAYYILIG